MKLKFTFTFNKVGGHLASVFAGAAESLDGDAVLESPFHNDRSMGYTTNKLTQEILNVLIWLHPRERGKFKGRRNRTAAILAEEGARAKLAFREESSTKY